MKTIDRDGLIEVLKSDIRKCMAAFRLKRPQETFYAFALYTDSDAVTVSAYANTNERLKKEIKKDPDAVWTKWSPDEWEFLDDENFMEASQDIVSDYNGLEGDAFHVRKQAVHQAFSTALNQLREEGLFDSQITLFVEISDASDDEIEIMRRIIREVNPESLATDMLESLYGES